MAEPREWGPVEWVTAGAVGEPGARTFYIQARHPDGSALCVLVEKGQVAGLAQLAQELLGRAGVTVTPDDLDEDAHRPLEGLEPLWRVGPMSLGMDEAGERFVLELAEFVADDEQAEPDVVRLWLSRDQLVGLAAYAAYAVEAGARPRCRLCGRPIDPEGHVCPASNGHGRLSR